MGRRARVYARLRDALTLWLQLLGERDEDIFADYALTEIGMQPAVPALTARFQKDRVFRENMARLQKMGGSGVCSRYMHTQRDTDY